MLSLILADEGLVTDSPLRKEVELQAPDLETLLVDWLTEIIYLMEDEFFIAFEVDILSLDNETLLADIIGVYGGEGIELQRHIKAVTYHDLWIEETEDGYQATIVFDV